MSRHTLFLLKPDFYDRETGPYFCPGCAEVLGYVAMYPHVKEGIEIHYLDFQRPRPELVELLGEENQSCPVLVLGEEHVECPDGVEIKTANGHSFIDEMAGIERYLATEHSTAIPH